MRVLSLWCFVDLLYVLQMLITRSIQLAWSKSINWQGKTIQVRGALIKIVFIEMKSLSIVVISCEMDLKFV